MTARIPPSNQADCCRSRLLCRCLRSLVSALLSPVAHAMSMLVISLTLLVTVGSLIARLENLGNRGRNDSIQYAVNLIVSGNLSDRQLMSQLEAWSQRARWNSAEGIYYVFSLFSTVGFGTYAPVTLAGRCVSGVFIVLFVPIGVLYIQNLSSVYQSMLSRLLIGWRPWLRSRNRLNRLIFPNGDDTIIVIPVTMLTVVLHLHLLFAVLFLCLMEGWTPMQSLYYLITTITTIGFGDFHPGPHSTSYVLATISFQLHMCAVFMLIINYLNDAFEWVQEAAQAHSDSRISVHPQYALAGLSPLSSMPSAISASGAAILSAGQGAGRATTNRLNRATDQ